MRPLNEDQAAAMVVDALARGIALSIQGGGTKRDMGRAAQEGETLSTAALKGVTLNEPAEMVVSARAGTPLAQVEAALAQNGQMLAFEPPDWRAMMGAEGEPTIGGVVALNLSGPRRIQAGACRDSLIGVRYINGKGEIIRTGGRVMKNVTGLDVVKLQCGAWGTLGLMSEVTFKVLPRPQSSLSIVLNGLNDDDGVHALTMAVTSPFEISAAAHIPARENAAARTIVRIEHFTASLAYRSQQIIRMWQPFGTAEVIDDAPSRALWTSIANVRLFDDLPASAIWRISLKPTDAPKFLAALPNALAQAHYYDWGGALVWMAVDPLGDAGAAAIRVALAAFGGHAMLARAPADIRAAVDVFQPLAQGLSALQRRVKTSLDPAGLFNPGRMYAGM